MNWKELEPKVAALQQGLKDTMEKVKQMASKEPQLPKPGKGYEDALAILANDTYEVVVCGEVKKGKSSFINSLLGQNLLPVNSDIATAQVFRISDSDNESFELVFTDGSRKAIAKEDLEKYGSQVSYNAVGDLDLEGKVIKYIDVHTHAAFLPKGVNLVDTPGLGALYRTHEAITKGYVRRAAAVVFVLDFEAPIGEQEVKFINAVLDVTPYVMYICTKVDLYSGDAISAIMNRNQEILNKIYEARNLKAPSIYAFSSTKLMEASTARLGKEARVKQSGYRNVEDELQKMIYRSVGLLRTGYGLVQCGEFVNKVNSVVGDIVTASMNSGKDAQLKLEKDKRDLQLQLQDQWNHSSGNHKSVESQIANICRAIPNKVSQIFSESGSIYRNYSKKIDSIESADEGEALGKRMSDSLAQDIESEWNSIMSDAIDDVNAVLSDACLQINSSSYSRIGSGSKISVPKMNTHDKYILFRNASGSALLTLGVAGLAAKLSAAIAAALAGPLGIIAGLIAILFGLFASKSAKAERAKKELQKGFRDALVSIRSELLDVKHGNNSIVGSFVDELQADAKKYLNTTVSNMKEELQAELEDLQRRGQMDIEEKARECEKWMAIQKDWKDMTAEINHLIATRKEITTALNQ